MNWEGHFNTPTGRFAIVAARFNSTIVDLLLHGAVDGFQRHGVPSEAIDTVRVPGSYEAPLIAQQLAASGKYVGIVCLGCVIRGDTTHYDHVAGAATSGLLQASLKTEIPIIFGVLTCETLEQAFHRAGAKAGNKGFEAALTAIEMANLQAVLQAQLPLLG